MSFESTSVVDRDTAHEAEWNSQLADARVGSREAQARLLEALRPFLLALAEDQLASDLRPKLAASDIVQNTVCQAWQGFEQFRGQTRGELVAWLRTILGHCAAAEARKYRGTGKRDVDRERSLERLAGEYRSILVDPATSPSGRAMAHERRREVEQAVRSLPPRYEQAIRLRNDLGLSFSEMGVALSCSEDAARMVWVRAIDKLGRKLPSDERDQR